MQEWNRYQRPAGYDRCEVCVRCRRLTRAERRSYTDSCYRFCEARGVIVDARAKVDEPGSGVYRCPFYGRRTR
jgi:hypothetical protein